MAAPQQTTATAASTSASVHGNGPPPSTGAGLNQYHGEMRANGASAPTSEARKFQA